MRVLFTTCLAIVLSSCSANKCHQVVGIYDSNDEFYKTALAMAKNDYPKYFSIAKNIGIEEKIIGIQIFGKGTECVMFKNETSKIIDIDVSVYCFDRRTHRFVTKI